MAIYSVTKVQRDALIELYVGYFNRAPEASGLDYWTQQLINGINAGKKEADVFTSIANKFYDAGMQFGYYPANLTVQDFIKISYANALGRDSVDQEGMDYWTKKLESGAVSRGEFVQKLISDAKAFAGDEEWGWVATYIQNRVAVGDYFAKNSEGLTGIEAMNAGIKALGAVTAEAAQAGQTPAQAIAEAQGANGRTFTLTEASVSVEGVNHLVIDAGSTATDTTIVTVLDDPIIKKQTYWISTNDGGAAPLSDLVELIKSSGALGSYLTTTFANIDDGLDLFNTSLENIAGITINGAGDDLQGEGVSGEGAVAGGAVTGAVGDLGTGSNTVGADGSDSDAPSIVYNEDGTVKEGDYTGNYEMTVTLADGTAYSAVLELSQSQLSFIRGLLFDANGNTRLEEREVEVYSYMPLLARNPETGELIPSTPLTSEAPEDQFGPYKVVIDYSTGDNLPVMVKAYDFRVVSETVENPDVVIDTPTAEKVLVPIVLTPTSNNGGTVEPFKPHTTTGDDVIVAGRLELLHQAYIDGGEGYNILEVDAKGTYAQPKALLNIQEVRVQDLPNVYTTDTGAGDGYLGNSSYGQPSNLNVNESTGIPATVFKPLVDASDEDTYVSISSLNVQVGSAPAAWIPDGYYTAEQLADAINVVAGQDIAEVIGGAIIVSSSVDAPEIYFGGNQASGLGLSNIANDGLLPAPLEGSVLDLSRAVDIEKLVITQGANSYDGATDNTPEMGDLTVIGVRNGATLRIEGGFDSDVNVFYSQGRSDEQPLKVELVVGTMAGNINISHNSDSLHLASLGGGSNTFGSTDLGDGTLSDLIISGNARLDIHGDLGDTFADSTPVSIDASQNEKGVSLYLTESEQVTFTGSAGNDYFAVDTSIGSDDTTDYVVIKDTTGNNHYVVDTYNATITTGNGNNRLEVGVEGDATITTGNGNQTMQVAAVGVSPGEGDVKITSGNGDSQIFVSDSVKTTLVNGDGDSTISVVADTSASVKNGNGNSLLTVTADAANVTNGNGNSVVTVTAEKSTVQVGTGNSDITVVGSDDASSASSITAGNGNTDIKVSDVADLTIVSGDGVSKMDIDATGVVSITSGNENKSIDITAAVSNIVLGNGNNDICANVIDAENCTLTNGDEYASAINVQVGNGNNQFEFDLGGGSPEISPTVVYKSGDGKNDIKGTADNIVIETGAGADNIVVAGRDINIKTAGGDDNITLVGLDDDYADNSALIKIDTGTGGKATVTLGLTTNPFNTDGIGSVANGQFTAKEGSSITGDNITLFVNTVADLRAATLTGITRVQLDDDATTYAGGPQANGADDADRVVLTLTDKQFLAIGAAKFSVDGAIFNTHAQVKIIITESTSLTALGIDTLAANIDLQLELNDGVTLTMTAQQLHERVAADGVMLAEDGNTGKLTGKVVITNAGTFTDPVTGAKSTFDPFNTSDATREGYGDAGYVGGSLSDDFFNSNTGKSINVSVVTKIGGYVRPVDSEVLQVLEIDTSNANEEVVVGYNDTWVEYLYIKGDQDLTFQATATPKALTPSDVANLMSFKDSVNRASINLGENYIVDFSELEGEVKNLTLEDFQDAAAIRGNSGAGYDATVQVKLKAYTDNPDTNQVDDVESAEAGGEGPNAPGLVTSGVNKYVVVSISDEDSSETDDETGTINLGDATLDVETIALRGNYNATLIVNNVPSGIDFELQGDGFNILNTVPSVFGPIATSNVGELVVNYADGADEAALVHINNQGVALTGRALHVAGITVNNAVSVSVDVEDGNVQIHSIEGDDLEELSFVSAKGIEVEATLPASLTNIDATDVDGNFVAQIGSDADDAFTLSTGNLANITLNAVTADKGTVIEATGVLNLTVTGATSLSDATLQGVDAVKMATGATLTLTANQVTDITQANISGVAGGDPEVLNITSLSTQVISATTLAANNVKLGSVGIASGTWTLDPATNLKGAAVTVAAGGVLTLTADQFMALGDLDGASDVNKSTINIVGLTQAHIDAGFDLSAADHANIIGSVTLASSLELAAGTDLNGFKVILPTGLTLGVATQDQADGLDVVGADNSTIKILFKTWDGTSIDASGYAVSKLQFANTLVDNGTPYDPVNIDEVFTGLKSTVTKSVYHAGVTLVDQTVTFEAGVTVPGNLAFNLMDDSTELEDFTLNLTGGAEIEGNVDLSVGDKSNDLIQTFLKTVTINSTGTAANLLTGKTANIITGDLTAEANLHSDDGGSDDTFENELTSITINADQNLIIEGALVFTSVINDDETANLLVTGSKNVTIGTLDSSDSDVDTVNVVNNGTGVLTLGLNANDDKLSFTGTGDIVLNITGAVDLTADVLTAVSQINLVNGATATLTAAQLIALGEANVDMKGADTTGTLVVTGFSNQPLDSTLVGSGVAVELTVAEGEHTLSTDADLTNVSKLTVGSDSTLNMSAEQALQLVAGVDTILDGAGDAGEVNVYGATQAHFTAGLAAVLASLSGQYEAGSLEIVDDVSLTASILNAASVGGFTLVGNKTDGDLRVNVDMDVLQVGIDADNGVVSSGINTYVITEMSASDGDVDATFYVCDSTEDLKTLGLQGNEGDTITFDGIKWGVNFVMEGDGVVDWTEVEKKDATYNESNIGALVANYYVPGATAVVNINNQGKTLGTGTDGERKLVVDGVTINDASAITINVADGDATITTVGGEDATSLTLTAVEDLSITNVLETQLTSIDATDVLGAFKAQLNDMDEAFTLQTGANATITLNSVKADAGTVIDGEGTLNLIVTGISVAGTDLSKATLDVDTIKIDADSNLTLSAAQVVTLTEAKITGTVESEGNLKEVLHIVGLSTQAISSAALSANDVQLGTVTIAAGNWVLQGDLAGATVIVPAGSTLTLTADQYMALADLDGVDTEGTEAHIIITGLTQAHIDAGFTLAGVGNVTGEVNLAPSVTTLNLTNDATGTIASEDATDLNGFEVNLTAGQTLGLANSTQADGLVINGDSSNTVVLQFLTLDGSDTQIDAAGYGVGQLKAVETFFLDLSDDNSGEENAEFIIKNLPEAVTLVVTNTPADIGITGYDRNVIIEAGATVPGEFVFNDIDPNKAVINLDITFEGDASITGDLRLATQGDVPTGKFGKYFDTLTINSEGEGVNSIGGSITANSDDVDNPVSADFNEAENNLLNVVINADTDFNLGEDIIFNKRGDNDASTTADNAEASLIVNGDSDVSMEAVDTSDNDVTALNVVNNSTGDLHLTVDENKIDAEDDLSFTGSNIVLTVLNTVDLSDDVITGVNKIKMSTTTDLTLTQAQVDASTLGANNIVTDDGPVPFIPSVPTLHIVEFIAAPFDGNIFVGNGINVQSITLAGTADFTAQPIDLTGVDRIIVPKGATLTLTATQFQQLEAAGTIVGVDSDGDPSTDYSVKIIGLNQSHVDAPTTEGYDFAGTSGLNLASITSTNIIVEVDGSVNLKDTTVLGTVGNLEFVLEDGQTLGLANMNQLSPTGTASHNGTAWVVAGVPTGSGLTVTGGEGTSVELQFTAGWGLRNAFDASGVAVETLRVLDVIVDQRDVELLQNLDSDVTVVVYETIDNLPGFVRYIDRLVVVEQGVTVDGFLAFIDVQGDSEVRTLGITMDGDATIDGNIWLSTTATTGELVKRYFDTLTINSIGDAQNTITGDISPMPLSLPPVTIENNLLNVVINADQDLVIGGDIIFNGINDGGPEVTANLTITGDADVEIHKLDVDDTELTTLRINNNGTGTLTVTGSSPAIEGDLELLDLNGTGNIVFGTAVNGYGVDSTTISKIDASGLSGNLTMDELREVDSNDFSFISGTGVTTLTVHNWTDLGDGVTNDANNPAGTWSFDFVNAASDSELHLQAFDYEEGSSLTINMGPNGTLFIDESMDLTALDLTLLGDQAIVLADGVTLTLTAAQASGLHIVAGSDTGAPGYTGKVMITDLGAYSDLDGSSQSLVKVESRNDDTDELVDYDFSGIEVAAEAYLFDNDVTISQASDLGNVAISLTDVSDDVTEAINDALTGQTIRFSTAEQAERVVNVVPGTSGAPSTNVVWLFSEVTAPVDTKDYDSDLTRLWLTEALVSNSNVEELFTTLPNTILRVEFGTLTELEVLLRSNGVDRVVEITSFNNVGNLTFEDMGVSPVEHLTSLKLDLGGEVTVGDIVVADIVGAPGYDAASIEFDGVTVNSYRSVRTDDLLASEGYVNDNDGVNEKKASSDIDFAISDDQYDSSLVGNENTLPVNMNTVGDINVGADNGLDLLDVNLNTFGVTAVGEDNPGDGAALTVGTITYETDAPDSWASLDVAGHNDITIASISASDSDIVDLSIYMDEFSADLTIAGTSPAINMGTAEELWIHGSDADSDQSSIKLGTDVPDDANDVNDNAGDNAGVSGSELSLIDASDYSGKLDAGILSNIDGTDDGEDTAAFTFVSGTGETDVKLGAADGEAPSLSAGSEWVFDFSNVDSDAADESSLTITGEVDFEAGSTLTLIEVPNVEIVGDVDFSDINLNLPLGGTIHVGAGQSLTLSVEQVLALQGDVSDPTDDVFITGSGTVRIVDDATIDSSGIGYDVSDDGEHTSNGPTDFSLKIGLDSVEFAAALAQNIKTVGIDISGLTIDSTDDTTGIGVLVSDSAIDDNDMLAGRHFIGSAENDFMVSVPFSDVSDAAVGPNSFDDTFTGGAGNDIYVGGFLGSDTYNVDSDSDLILGLGTVVSAGEDSSLPPFGPLQGTDILVVSEGATAYGFVGTALNAINEGVLIGSDGSFEFVADSNTVNDGTAILIGGWLDDTLIDVSLAGGSKGFTLIGGADLPGGSDDSFVILQDALASDDNDNLGDLAIDVAIQFAEGHAASSDDGLDILVGSANDDILMGGNDQQESDSALDILTGNDGSDQFVFNINVPDPAGLTFDTSDGADEELIFVSKAATTDSAAYKLTVNYTLNDVLSSIEINDADIVGGIDFSSDADIADAIAFVLDAQDGISAVVSDDDLTVIVTGDGINDVEILAVDPNIDNVSGFSDSDFVITDGEDVAQVTTVTVDPVESAEAGQLYSMTVTLADGTEITAEYTTVAGDSDADIAEGLELDFADAGVIASWVEGSSSIVLTDSDADDGGFTVDYTAAGSFTGSGASNKLADIETADIITDFVTGVDTIVFHDLSDGTADNYMEADAEFDTFDEARDAANAAFTADSELLYFFASVGDDTYEPGFANNLQAREYSGLTFGTESNINQADIEGVLFFDANQDGTVDGVIHLVGITSDKIDFTDIVMMK